METNTENSIFHYEVGPEQTRPVALDVINSVSQTRRAYPEEGIDELATSMILVDENGKLKGLELLNPPILAKFNAVTATDYLSELNDLFGTQHHIDELTADDKDNYFILIAGHRRSLALARAAEICGVMAKEIGVRSVVHDNISFDKAFTLQTKENIYEKPAPQDEAEAIAKFCAYKRRKSLDGKQISVAECARQLGLKETKVRHALKYADLPEQVKSFVDNGALTYTDGVIINDVQRVYRAREEQKQAANPVNVEDATSFLTTTFAMRAINRKSRRGLGERFGAKEFLRLVAGEIDTVRQSIWHNGDLFLMDEMQETPRAQRALAVGHLSTTAISLVGIIMEQDPAAADKLVEALFAKLPDDKLSDFTAQARLL